MVDERAGQVTEEPEKEAVETVDELVKEKADNNFIARENTAYNQYFIQYASFDKEPKFEPVSDSSKVSTGEDKKYDLENEEECAEFFSSCKHRDYILLAISLSVFEMISIGDYANLKNTLMECLPVVERFDEDGKEIYIQRSNPYMPLNAALSVIGGNIFISDEGHQCIGYGKGGEKTLKNIWIQLPDLRKPIIDWLIKTNESFEYRTSFEIYQIVSAFMRIIRNDFPYAKKQVFVRLYSKPDNLGFLARLAQELIKDDSFKEDVLDMVLKWAKPESDWMWKTAFLVCLYKYDFNVYNQLCKVMSGVFKKKMFGFQNSDLRFIVLFAGKSRNARAIVASVFHDLYQLKSSVQERKSLSQIYLKMIRYGYYLVNKNKIDLPFVVCDSKEQINNMQSVLAFIMTQYDLYCQLCRILQVYLEEISDYKVSGRTISYITAYFYVLTKDSVDYQRDILFSYQQEFRC